MDKAMARMMLKAINGKKCSCIDKARQEKIKRVLNDNIKH